MYMLCLFDTAAGYTKKERQIDDEEKRSDGNELFSWRSRSTQFTINEQPRKSPAGISDYKSNCDLAGFLINSFEEKREENKIFII